MNNINILIVEDESIIALDIESIIDELGYNVIASVNSYEECIKTISHKRVDIVLLDIRLEKELDGIDIAKKIKEIKNIPIIFITAFADDKTRKSAIDTNPCGFIVKPFKKKDIQVNIELVIQRRGLLKTLKSDIFKIDSSYSFDLTNDILLYQNSPQNLSIKENQFIKLLVESKGNLVTISEIEFYLWSEKP